MTQAQQPPSGGMARSAAFFFAARIASYIITLALPMVLVRILSQRDFGIYKQIFLVIGSLVNYLPFGFSTNMYYFFPRFPEKHPAIVANTLAVLASLGILITTLLWVSPDLLVFLSKDNSIAEYAPAVGVLAALWMTVYTFEILPIVLGETKIVVALALVVQLSRSGLLLAAALSFGTVSALLWAMLVQLLLQGAAFYVYLIRRFPHFWRDIEISLVRQQVVYILKISFTSVLFALVTLDMHQYAVSNQFGPEIFAIYAAGCFQIPLSAILIEAVGPLLIREASRLEHLKDRPAVLRLMLNSSRQIGLVLFPLYALLSAVATEFILFFFTSRYSASVPIFLVNITLIPMAAIVSDPVSRAYPERQNTVIRFRFGLSAVAVTALWILTPWLGPIAAISCIAVCLLIDRIFMAVYWSSFLGFRWSEQKSFILDALATFAIALLAGVLTFMIKPVLAPLPLFWFLAAASIFFTGVYAALMIAFSIPNPAELQMLRNLVQRFIPLRPRS